MKILIYLVILNSWLFATAPDHNWTGQLKSCALSALNKKSDYVLTKEALETIKEFYCSYSGRIDIEPLQDLSNIEVLRMRRNEIHSDTITYHDGNDTAFWFDENTSIYTQRWIEQLSNVFFGTDINESAERNTTQEIPQWIGDLSSLKEIDFSGNDMEGNIPVSIATLSNLETLDLANNRFAKLPIGIENMTALKVLDVSHNELVQKFPSEITQLVNLEKLYLQENSLHGEIPDLSPLIKLKSLRLNGNNLRLQVPYSFVDLNLTEPRGLALHDNCRISLPDDESAETNATRDWLNAKASARGGFERMEDTNGDCWSPGMVPVIFYLLSDVNQTQ